MRRLSIPVLAGVAVVVGVLSWALDGLLLRGGRSPLPVPWTVSGALVVAAAVALWLGWRVRQYQAGNKPGLSPIEAARTAMFAQAAAYSGAALVGIYAAHAIALVGDWGHAPRQVVIVAALVAAAASLVLMIAGIVAERWCATGGDDDDSAASAAAGAA